MSQLFKIWFILFVLSFTLFDALGQNRSNISGVIVDADNMDVLPGVIITSKQSKVSTVSKSDGSYSLSVAKTDTLIFNLLGFFQQTVPINNKPVVDVKLKTAITTLENVVVIGYGTSRKEDLTGAVAVVNMNDLNKAPVASLTEGLAGRIAGVNVSANGGQPGDEMNIVIRGGNSLTQDNSPLYVIDGFPLEGAAIDAINPNDIESVTVLKDASATAIYGSRGANGVIIIETKKGKEGMPRVVYDASYGVQQVVESMDMMNPYEFVKYQIELSPTAMTDMYLTNQNKTLDDYKNIKGVDWQSMLFQSASWNRHNLSLTGGSKTTKYAISGSILNREGVIINSGYDRKQGRISLTQDVNKKLKIAGNVNYSKIKDFGERVSSEDLNTNTFSTFLLYRAWGYRPISSSVIAAQEDGTFDYEDFLDDLLDPEISDSRINPIVSTRNVIRDRERSNLKMDGSLSYSITNDLVLRVLGGYSSNVAISESFNNSKTFRGFPSANNVNGLNGSYSSLGTQDFQNSNTLTYSKKIGRTHNFGATVGYTYQTRSLKSYGFDVVNVPYEELGLSGMDFGIPNTVNSRYSKNKLQSYLGRLNYTYKSKYIFTGTFRADGSSKFSPDNQWGYFPSGAFAWRFINEKFVKNNFKFISDGKLRLSHGLTGNNRINDAAIFTSLSQPYSAYYPSGNNTPDIGITISDFGNKDLRWETTAQTDLGLELGFIKNRVNLEIDLYRKKTSDMLLYANVPRSSGFSKIYKNIGKMQNEGLEISLNTVNINSKNFKWRSDINISFNRNKVLELAEDEQTLLSSVGWNSSWNNTFLYAAKVGEPVAAFYGFVWEGNYQYEDFDIDLAGDYKLKKNIADNGIDRDNIKPGDVKYKDMNGDGALNDEDLTVIGKALPTHFGGFNNNFSYKNFNLNIFFQWNYGNEIYNGNRMAFEGNVNGVLNINQFASYADRWSPENTGSENARAGGNGPVGVYSSKHIEDGSFLRLKTISLEYALPKKIVSKLRMLDISAYVSAQNLYTWHNYSGIDPEVSVRNSTLTPGFDFSSYPISRNITFGVKIGL